MRMLILLLLAVQSAYLFAQPATLAESDKAAIKATLERETSCYYTGDYDCWLSCWSRDADIAAFVAKDGHVYERISWKTWSEGVQSDLRGRTAPDPTITRRDNFNFLALGDAEVACYFDAYNTLEDKCTYSREIRILRKENGQWKLVFMSALFDSHRGCGG